MYREHPLRIVRYCIKNIWLLVFPLLRKLFTQHPSPETVFEWLQSSRFDLFILLLILCFGWMRWYFRKFSVNQGEICVQDGFLIRRSRCIPTERISSLTLEYPLFLRPFGAMYLCADTAARVLRTHDLRLLIRKGDAELFRRTHPRLRSNGRHRCRHKVHPWRILLFSVIFSSSLSGSLYAAAFWFQGGRISRDLIEEFALTERLSAVSEEVARRLYGIPPAAVAIGIVILSARLLSLTSNLLRYGSFTMETDGRLLFVCSGILTKRSAFLYNDKINFLDIRQSLLTKLCGVFSLAISCPGYESRRAAIPVCLPILRKAELLATIPLLLTDAALPENELKPRPTAWWGYVWAPVIGAAAIVPAAEILTRLFPALESVVGFLQLMLLIPLGWKLLVQIAALCTSGMCLTENGICLRYCRGFVFHTIAAKRSAVVKIQIRRNFWQIPFGKCNLTVYLHSEETHRCVLRNLDYRSTAAAIGSLHSDATQSA